MQCYFAAIKFCHRIYAGWALPTVHCMFVGVFKGLERTHGSSNVKRENVTSG